MTKFLQVSYFIILFPLSSCSNEEKTPVNNNPVIYRGKYSLEIDKNYKVFKVTFSGETNDNFTVEYNYLKDSIIETKRTHYNTLVTTYYLNYQALADSCKSSSLDGISKSYFYYDSIGYLKTSIEKGVSVLTTDHVLTTNYEYVDGNLISVTFNPWKSVINIYSINYLYNSSTNLINLENFTGSWLGVLNKNLVEKMLERTLMSNIVCNYNYTVNSNGLVEKMTTIGYWNDGHSQNNETTTITLFEYRIIE